MITSMKVMSKRFRLLAPLLLAIMVAAIVAGAVEMSIICTSAVQHNFEFGHDGVNGSHFFNALIHHPDEGFIAISFIVICLLSAIIVAYKNEHNYSTNMMVTKNQNIIANSMLGTIVALMIAATYGIAYYAGMHMGASSSGYIISSSVESSLVGIIALGALIYFIIFNAMYYVILFLANLFKRNKLLCLIAVLGVVLIYMCIFVFPLGTLEEKHPYMVFISSWKGQMSAAALYVVLGAASYVGLVKKSEVKK